MEDALRHIGAKHPVPLLLAVSLALSACNGLDSDSGAGAPPPSCSTAFTRIIEPVQINGHKHLYFNASDFDLLYDPRYLIEDVSLHVSLKGKHECKDENGKSKGSDQKHAGEAENSSFTLDLNGIAASSSGGAAFYHHLGYNAVYDSSRHSFKLRKMRLNGTDRIDWAFLKIKRRKGQVRIGLHGKDLQILSAWIEVTGHDLKACEPAPTPTPSATPSPAPTTPPVAPDTFINSVTPAGSPVASASIAFALSSDQAGVNYICSLDGVGAACNGNPTYSGLASGTHTFTAAATNAAGLSDASPASYTWVVDVDAPSVTITNRASLPTLTNDASIEFQFVAADASPSTFTCSLDGATATPCNSPKAYAGLSEGAHSIAIHAVDAAGNLSETPAVFQWNIDLTAPAASFTQIDPVGAITNLTSASFSFGASETSTFECALDGAGFASCASPLDLTGLAEGGHSLQVRATDLAGNASTEISHLWTVDLTAPVIALGQVVPAQGLTSAQAISVEFAANEQSTYRCAFDGVDQGDCASPFTASVAAEGNHEFSVIATDSAGNASAAAVASWIMDFTLPQIAWGPILPSAASVINSSDLTAEVTSSEPVTLACTLDSADLGISASPIALTGLVEGPHVIGATGTDSAGNPGTPITHSFTVDLTAPAAGVSATYAAVTTNQTVNGMTFSANEAASFECNLDEAGFEACESPLNISGLAEGEHTFEVRATDLAGNVGASASVTWNVDTTAPLTSITVNQTAREDFTFTLAADEAISGFECSLDGAAFTSCGATKSYAGLSVGAHAFTARATDLAGNLDSAGTTVTIQVLSPIATILGAVTPAQSPTNSTSISAAFSSNQTGATFRCSLDGAAATVCVSPASYTGLTEGTHNFRVYAVDRFGAVDSVGATYIWNIDLTAPDTTLTPSRNSNSAISFSFIANEATSGYQCSLDGAAFSACVSPIGYSGLATGSHTFEVRATDIAGNLETTAASYTWTVDPPVATFITSTTPAAAVTNLTSQAISFNSNHADAIFRCSLDGAALTACTSPISYSGLAEGAHTFRVHAIDRWGTMDTVGATYSWTIDLTAPTVVSFTPTGGSFKVTVTWTTSEPATSKVNWGLGTDTSRVVAEDSVYKTSHIVVISGLSPATNYSFIVSGRDQAGNVYTSVKKTVRTF